MNDKYNILLLLIYLYMKKINKVEQKERKKSMNELENTEIEDIKKKITYWKDKVKNS